MNRRTRVLVALARRMPHPEPPTARYLARARRELPAPALTRRLLGAVPRRIRITDQVVPLGSGDRPARVYEPWPRTRSDPLPLVVNFHGGGFVFGNLGQTDWLCGQLAGRVGAVVVSVSYRLAPESPAPVPFEDCRDATSWLLDHAQDLGADPTRVSVMGASAGGNLAALVALAHRDRRRHEPGLAPLATQVLVYPATDLTLSSPSVDELSEAPILTRAILDWFGRRYLPQGRPDSISGDDPSVSPLLAVDHTDLAPALIFAAGQDPLRDDALRYGERLQQAGVPNRVVLYADAIHGFIAMPRLATEASLALAEIVGTLSGQMPLVSRTSERDQSIA